MQSAQPSSLQFESLCPKELGTRRLFGIFPYGKLCNLDRRGRLGLGAEDRRSLGLEEKPEPALDGGEDRI